MQSKQILIGTVSRNISRADRKETKVKDYAVYYRERRNTSDKIKQLDYHCMDKRIAREFAEIDLDLKKYVIIKVELINKF